MATDVAEQRFSLESLQEQLGIAAYVAYSESRNGKAFNGDPLPEWNKLPPEIKAAWRAAGFETVQAYFGLAITTVDEDAPLNPDPDAQYHRVPESQEWRACHCDMCLEARSPQE